MKFKVGDKVLMKAAGETLYLVGELVEIRPHMYWPYLITFGDATASVNNGCPVPGDLAHGEELILVDDLTELERLYYGV